jgi:hypothetical protein
MRQLKRMESHGRQELSQFIGTGFFNIQPRLARFTLIACWPCKGGLLPFQPPRFEQVPIDSHMDALAT